MKNRWTVALLGLGALLLSGVAKAEEAKKPIWRTDYAAARAEAKRTGKPLFVVFRCQP
jgi:hypothetical protein